MLFRATELHTVEAIDVKIQAKYGWGNVRIWKCFKHMTEIWETSNCQALPSNSYYTNYCKM